MVGTNRRLPRGTKRNARESPATVSIDVASDGPRHAAAGALLPAAAFQERETQMRWLILAIVSAAGCQFSGDYSVDGIEVKGGPYSAEQMSKIVDAERRNLGLTGEPGDFDASLVFQNDCRCPGGYHACTTWNKATALAGDRVQACVENGNVNMLRDVAHELGHMLLLMHTGDIDDDHSILTGHLNDPTMGALMELQSC